jgi:hypothetical protein
MLGNERMPSPCPCCGSLVLAPDLQASQLVTVCDVLCHKALERVGAFLVRGRRARFLSSRDLPPSLLHTRWSLDDTVCADDDADCLTCRAQRIDDLLTRALHGAWDIVPALVESHGCCGIDPDDVIAMLDEYVRDLAITGTPHTLDGPGGLTYRVRTWLGISVLEHAHG